MESLKTINMGATKDSGFSWIVLLVAFIGQAMSNGFHSCYSVLFVSILKTYNTTENEAGE